MNKVIEMGRLTRDPELKEKGQTSYLRFGIAVDRRFKKEGQPTADFPSVVAFGKDAENIAKYFRKGSMICISGRLQTGSYTNKDGAKVYTTDIVVEEWSFCGSKKDDVSDYAAPSFSGASSGSSADEGGFMDIPEGIENELPFH